VALQEPGDLHMLPACLNLTFINSLRKAPTIERLEAHTAVDINVLTRDVR